MEMFPWPRYVWQSMRRETSKTGVQISAVVHGWGRYDGDVSYEIPVRLMVVG